MIINLMTNYFVQIFLHFILDFFVPHFNAELDLRLFSDVVKETDGAFMIQQSDRCVEILFITRICGFHPVVCVFVNIDVKITVRH